MVVVHKWIPNLVTIYVILLAAFRFVAWLILNYYSYPEIESILLAYMQRTEGNFYLGISLFAIAVFFYMNFNYKNARK